jgi:transcriptional regulator with XRE-family HTH domain
MEVTRRHRLPADVAAALGAHRLARGLGQREAARRAGISQGYIWLLEHGERCPSVEVAAALADALELGPELAGRLLDVARRDAGRSSHWRRAAEADQLSV